MPKNPDARQRGGSSKETREGEGSKELYRSASGRQRRQQQTKGETGEGEIKPIWNGGTRGLGEIYKPGG
jgi:hypothetical protein